MAELTRIRIGTDIVMSVGLSDSGIKLSWDSVEIKHVVLYSDVQRVQAGRGKYSVNPDDAEQMTVRYMAGQQCYLGAYRLVVQFVMGAGEGVEGRTYTADVPCFELVATTEEVGNVPSSGGDDDVIGLRLDLESIDSSLVQELIDACINAAEDANAAAASAEETDAAVKVNEAARIKAEDARQTNETARISNEKGRKAAEGLRVTAENKRVEAESSRSAAEIGRVSAEQARVKAEESRVSAEQARVSAESKRQTDTAAAVKNANDAARRADDIAEELKKGNVLDRLGKVETGLSGKVDKVEGKGLSTNDYTDEEKGKLAKLQPFSIGAIGQLTGSSSQQDIEAALGCTCDELAAAILAGRPILVTDGSSYSPVVVAGATAEMITMRLKEPTFYGLLGVEIYCMLGKSGGTWAFTTFSLSQMLSSENIADNLTTGQYDGNYVLSAYQGKVLKGMVDSLEASVDASLNDITDILTKINNEQL